MLLYGLIRVNLDYTVQFVLDTNVLSGNELVGNHRFIKILMHNIKVDVVGFISVKRFHQVCNDVVEHHCSAGFIKWNGFWQFILDLDKSLGGLKHSSLMRTVGEPNFLIRWTFQHCTLSW